MHIHNLKKDRHCLPYLFSFFYFSESKRSCWGCLSRSWSSRKWQEDGLNFPVSSLYSTLNCSQVTPSQIKYQKHTQVPCILLIFWPAHGSFLYVCQMFRNQTAAYFLTLQWIAIANLAQFMKSIGWYGRRGMFAQFMCILCLVYVVLVYLYKSEQLGCCQQKNVIIRRIRRTPGGLVFLWTDWLKILSLAADWTELYWKHTVLFVCILTMGAVMDSNWTEFTSDGFSCLKYSRTVSISPDYFEVTEIVTSGSRSDCQLFL